MGVFEEKRVVGFLRGIKCPLFLLFFAEKVAFLVG